MTIDHKTLLALRTQAQAFMQAADEVLGENQPSPKKHLKKKEKLSERFARMYEKNKTT